MKFMYLELDNYIGIYNGMGLTNIKIDMSKCMYRTLIIRGENGSGKSTIFKAMSVFPDSNDAFIPGQAATKKVVILDHDVLYSIIFYHGVKMNGDRDTTKAYISKTVNGQVYDLNTNGNVSSFKDIISDELNLDPNFLALSQLSSDDKGLANKRPAERKKFVGSIIDSLEVYNAIYKSISKKSSNLKAVIDSLTAKLGTIGDVSNLAKQLADVEFIINGHQASIDEANNKIMMLNTQIVSMDPDGSLRDRNRELANKLNSLRRSIDKKINGYGRTFLGPDNELYFLRQEIQRVESSIKDINTVLPSYQSNISNARLEIANTTQEKEDKELKLSSMASEKQMDELIRLHDECESKLKELADSIAVSGIDPNLFTKDEYILALETINDIKHSIDLFRSDYSYEVIDGAIKMYEELGYPATVINIPTDNIEHSIEESRARLSKLDSDIATYQKEMEDIKALSNRPSDCKNDSCYYIANLLAIEKTDPKALFDKASKDRSDLYDRLQDLEKRYGYAKDLNKALNDIRVIIRYIDKNNSILSRLPNGGIFSNKFTFFSDLLSGNDFSYMDTLYSYIDLANQVEEYHKTRELEQEYKNKLTLYESKLVIVDSLKQEIAKLEGRLTTLTDHMLKMQNSTNELLSTLNLNQNSLLELKNREAYMVELKAMVDDYNMSQQQSVSLSNSMQSIMEKMKEIQELTKEVNSNKSAMNIVKSTRDNLVFTIKQSQQYTDELATLQDQYNRVETIKHYSSPTSGIQLVFMELYMGKILSLANDLLGLLFNGEYIIQPFIINESEFRIPCMGSGILNDDISSMSTSQLTMISMIISFSLLYSSSTKYNILKLDEIDGPLDENNRVMFIDVMNRIMDIMNVEQCIMVSHSSELQVDTSDVILLKSSQLSTDYDRGNIIWRY